MSAATAKVRDLKHSLPSVCRALTRQKGIKLVFQGPPRTDGETIYSNPLPIEAGEDQIAIITGDIDHECGHVLYTDFDVLKSNINAVPDDRRQFIKNVHNALEDTFIERRLGEDYLGCRSTLAVSVELMEQDIKTVGTDEPAQAFVQYLDAWGRVNVLRQKVEKTLAASEKVIEGLISNVGRIQLDGLLSAHLYTVDSTSATFDLALGIQRLLEDLAKDDPEAQQPQQEQSQPSPGSDCGDPSGQPQIQSPPQTPQGAGGSGTPADGGQPSQDQGQSQSAASAASAGSQSVLADNTAAQPLFDRRKAAEKAAASAAQDSMVMPEDDDGAGGSGASHGGHMFVSPSIDRYRTLHASTGGVIHDLQRRLVSEYQTQTRRRQVITDAGRLDSHRLPRAVLGDPMIHRNKVKRELPYPAVSLVIDCSGSMSGDKITTALQSLIAVTEANRQIGVKTEIIAFAGGDTRIVKTFDTDLNGQVKSLIGGLQASGGTPTAEALWLAGQRLAARREARRLLLLITDGIPNDHVKAMQISALIVRSGIELYGIGIGTDAVKSLCPWSSVVFDAAQIAPAVLGAIRSRLLHAA